MQPMPTKNQYRKLITLVMVIVVTYLLVQQRNSIGTAVTTLRHAYWPFVVVAWGIWAVSILSSAGVYAVLARRKLRLGRTSVVQLATGFTNRLAPAGAGGIALNVRYLMKNGYKQIEATALSLLNNLLGFVANMLVLFAIVLTVDVDVPSLHVFHPSSVIEVAVGILFVICAVGVYVLRRSIAKRVRTILRRILSIRPTLAGVAGGLLLSVVTTAAYSSCLLVMGLSLNVHISFADAVVIMSFGVAIATVTPTPGGIGGAETALVAGLIAVGVSNHQALALALVYRLFTYWLPIVPGFVALEQARQKHYI